MNQDRKTWIALQLRLTTFYSEVMPTSTESVIKSAFEIDPISIEIKMMERRRTEVASLGPGNLTFSTVINRADWVWDTAGPFDVLGEVTECLETFLGPLLRWIGGQSGILRVGLGVRAGVHVRNREDGYRLLNVLIDELQVDPNTSDLVYRINRQSTERLGEVELMLNKIENWSCQRVTEGVFAIGPGAPVAFEAPEESAVYHAVCELDFNSDAKSKVVLSESQSVALLGLCKDRVMQFLDSKKSEG